MKMYFKSFCKSLIYNWLNCYVYNYMIVITVSGNETQFMLFIVKTINILQYYHTNQNFEFLNNNFYITPIF